MANPDAYSVDEDDVMWTDAPGVLSNDTGESISSTIVSQPSHGTVVLHSFGAFGYRPFDNYHGHDEFTYELIPGVTATVSLTINPVNDPPVLYQTEFSAGQGYEDSQIIHSSGLLLSAVTDLDGDQLQTELVGQPALGTVSLSMYGSFVYTPNQDFYGTDSFAFQVIDGHGGVSSTGTVWLTITSANDPPIAVDDSFSLAEDDQCFTFNVLSNDWDVDGDPLYTAATSGAGHGTVVWLANGYFQYIPALNYSGADSFSYSVQDGYGSVAYANVSLWVTALNDAPLASADAFSIADDGTLTVTAETGLLTNDVDIDTSGPLTATLTQSPQTGQVQVNADGSFTYMPNANFHGVDIFSYQAHDGETASDPVYVTITVNPVNDAPLVTGETYTLNEDEPLSTGSLLANDSDVEGSYLTTSLLDPPAHGTVSLDGNGYFIYTPNPNYNGPDSFTYLVSDWYAQTMGTVELTVTPVNDAPVAVDRWFTTDEDTPLIVNDLAGGLLAGASDVDSTLLSVSVFTSPVHGTVVVNNSYVGDFSYAPSGNYYGEDSFTYLVSDGNANVLVTAYVTINSVFDAPLAFDDSYEFSPGDFLGASDSTGIMENDIRIELSPETFAVLIEPALYGTVQLNALGGFEYVPGPEFPGSDTFKYVLQQGNMVSPPTTVAIEIVFDLDTFKIALNQPAGLLEEEIEETEGAYLPANSDVDLYREANVNIRSSTFSFANPDYGTQWDQDMYWPIDAIAIPDENDLLPILLPKSDGKYTYTLTIPEHLRVWKKSDRTGAVVSEFTDLVGDDEAARTFYVEGINIPGSPASGLLKLNVKAPFVKVNVDRITISTFGWAGPQNVPGNAIYDYYAVGGKSGESLWTGATHGGLLDDAVDHAIIKWDSGPSVGMAVYQASLKYQWGLNVNVVHVFVSSDDEFEFPIEEFSSGTPIAGPVDGPMFPVVSKTVPNGVPGFSWQAFVLMAGPNGNRGVSYISGGFTQALMDFKARVRFGTVNKTQELQPLNFPAFPIRDAVRSMPVDNVLYTDSPQATFKGSSKLIRTNDTPGLPIPMTYDHGVAVEAGDDVVDCR